MERNYLGYAGKVANGITTVHLSYVREKTGHALIRPPPGSDPRLAHQRPVPSLVMRLPLELS